jgi:hypothetical protein
MVSSLILQHHTTFTHLPSPPPPYVLLCPIQSHMLTPLRLQITYRSAPPTSHVSQLHLYNSYKTRFDPYATHSPLLGGQELVQLACATFSGCEMAKSDDDYIIRGMKVKEDLSQGQASGGSDHLEKRVDDLVEPLRGATW